MTGSGVPIPPLDNSDEPGREWNLTQALENAYYARDADALRRIAHQVERQLAELRRRIPPTTCRCFDS